MSLLSKYFTAYNKMTSIPNEVALLTSLTKLDFSKFFWLIGSGHTHQYISGTVDIVLLLQDTNLVSSFRIATIGGNQLTAIPSELKNLASLRRFTISEWKIDCWCYFIQYFVHGLENDSHNLILSPNGHFSIVAIVGNQITSIPSEVGFMTSLTSLSAGKCCPYDIIE